MTDKEKLEAIKAELHRLKEVRGVYKDIYNDIFAFYNSLPSVPVSEDLQEFIIAKYNEIVGSHGEYDKTYIDGMAKAAAIECGMAGAQWQHKQLEKNRLAACERATKEEIEREQDFCDKIIISEHRQPTYSDAIEYGIEWQKNKGTLTWEDIPKLFHIAENLKTSWWFRDNEQTKEIGKQPFWEEVLKRFNERKNNSV